MENRRDIDAYLMFRYSPPLRSQANDYLPRRTGWAAQRHQFWGNAKEGRRQHAS